MIDKHGTATGQVWGDTNGGASTSLNQTSDIAGELRRRRGAADRLPPLDKGSRDTLNGQRLPHSSSTCSRGFDCLAQPLEVLARIHHCPCAEAMAALAGVTA